MTKGEALAIREQVIKAKKMEGIDVADRPEFNKVGHHLEPVLIDPTHLAWVVVKDEDYVEPSGSFTNPTEWTPGMQIVAGVNDDYISDGWYVFEGLVRRCLISGAPESFDDAAFWEII